MNHDEFDQFVADLETHASQAHDFEDMIYRTAGSMQPLLAHPHLLRDEFMQELIEGLGDGRLYHSQQHNFVILAFGWAAGAETPIHDHNTWGVMGIYRNQLQITEYQMNGTDVPGTFDIDEKQRYLANQGDVSYVLPPYDEIHRIANISHAPAISIHVYGKPIEDYNLFDLKNGKILNSNG